ncbi:DNA/RNA-binding protein kin17 [Physocladia obscura]|uniref:DNA/RNA-binding protein kin17 n=1 Tax=Physocladia obscura TaxID=109957 RepID=A0AAD5XFB1_9FUNG|nr:DNA/RNA-binding protein kin17 [Physocladia obscura]
MALFAESSHKYVAGFSSQFKADFMKILSLSHGSKRVHANVVYQEYIANKDHVHMNSTCWNSLNGFIRTMASQGRLILEETEKGPFITWVDDRPETLARAQAIANKEKMEKSEDERNTKLLSEQIERAKTSITVAESEFTELRKEPGDEPLKLKLEFKTKGGGSGGIVQDSANNNGSTLSAVANGSQLDSGETLNKSSWDDQTPFGIADLSTAEATAKSIQTKKPTGFSFGASSSIARSAPGSVLNKKPSWMKSDKSSDKSSNNSVDAPRATTFAIAPPVKKLSAMQQILEDEKRKREWRDGGSGHVSKRIK